MVGSPPYAESIGNENHIDYSKGKTPGGGKKGSHARDAIGGSYGGTDGQLGSLREGDVDAVLGSPPYAEGGGHKSGKADRDIEHGKGVYTPCDNYGETSGQLGAMKEGDVDSVVSSPPYEGIDINDKRRVRDGYGGGHSANEKRNYGETSGQLGAMKEGDVDSVVSSPPYEEGLGHDSGHPRLDKVEDARRETNGSARRSGYMAGEMGAGETFWLAARTILEQVHQLLRPNGVTAWIVKDYVKAGKRVPFCDNWARLCEAVGFEVIQRARCHLVKEETHAGLFGDVTKKTERKSFFRRLHERKPGAVRIDWEEVVFARKP